MSKHKYFSVDSEVLVWSAGVALLLWFLVLILVGMQYTRDCRADAMKLKYPAAEIVLLCK